MTVIKTINLGFSNAILLQGQGTILVDTGVKHEPAVYMEKLQAAGVEPQDIDLIIITHGHVDHFGGAATLKKLTGAPLLCHRYAVAKLAAAVQENVQPRNDLGQRVKKLIKGGHLLAVEAVEADLVMDEEFELLPFGIDGKILHTPGHSDCSVSVLLDDGTAIVGDIFIASPFTGEPAVAYFADDESALWQSVKYLLDHATLFYGGHGGPFTSVELQPIYAERR